MNVPFPHQVQLSLIKKLICLLSDNDFSTFAAPFHVLLSYLFFSIFKRIIHETIRVLADAHH